MPELIPGKSEQAMMQITSTKVIRRKSPSGVCVEFTGSNAETIAVELRGEFGDLSDNDIISRAKAIMNSAGGVSAQGNPPDQQAFDTAKA
jgi:hypothetical protein